MIMYKEICGNLDSADFVDRASFNASFSATIVHSRIEQGWASSASQAGITISYVGRGSEDYRIAGRHYRLRSDEFMISPQILGSEVEVKRRDDAKGTLGLCVHFPDPGEESLVMLTAPVVFHASSPLGLTLGRTLRKLEGPMRQSDAPHRSALAIHRQLGPTLAMLGEQLSNFPDQRPHKRMEIVGRMNLARSYLHKVLERPVPLGELAREAGVSPYHLLRVFRACFGETPSRYHRRLRLIAACQFAEEHELSLAFVSDLFGFAGGSSLTHAHKRVFGCPPKQDRGTDGPSRCQAE